MIQDSTMQVKKKEFAQIYDAVIFFIINELEQLGFLISIFLIVFKPIHDVYTYFVIKEKVPFARFSS